MDGADLRSAPEIFRLVRQTFDITKPLCQAHHLLAQPTTSKLQLTLLIIKKPKRASLIKSFNKI
jgi:hypothetical protein